LEKKGAASDGAFLFFRS